VKLSVTKKFSSLHNPKLSVLFVVCTWCTSVQIETLSNDFGHFQSFQMTLNCVHDRGPCNLNQCLGLTWIQFCCNFNLSMRGNYEDACSSDVFIYPFTYIVPIVSLTKAVIHSFRIFL